MLIQKNLRYFFHKLAKDLKDREIFYRSILKENYFGFKFVNQNLLNMYEVYEGNNFNGIRDNKMYQNFVESIRNYLKANIMDN